MSTPHESLKGRAGSDRVKKRRAVRLAGSAKPASARVTGSVSAKDRADPIRPNPARKPQWPDQHTLECMVAEAAYYLAEKRNFAPGHEEADWLAATEQITAQLRRGHTPVRKD